MSKPALAVVALLALALCAAAPSTAVEVSDFVLEWSTEEEIPGNKKLVCNGYRRVENDGQTCTIYRCTECCLYAPDGSVISCNVNCNGEPCVITM